MRKGGLAHMKIAYVCADLGIPVLGNKGAAVHVREFADALVRLGHDVRVICAAGTGGDETAPQNSLLAPVVVLPPSTDNKKAALWFAESLIRIDWPRDPLHIRSEMRHVLADAEFVEQATPIVREFAPDLVIARHALFSIAGSELARLVGCPCVLEVNAPLREERRRYWGLTLDEVAEQGEHKAFSEADLIIAVSEGTRHYVQRCGGTPEKILVLPNGVNLHHFSPQIDGVRQRQALHVENRTVIGFAGSLKPWHGLDELLIAYADVRALLPDMLHLLVVGDGPEREHLEQLQHQLGIDDDVTMVGAVPHHAVPEYLAAMDIAVAPYLATNGFYFSPQKVMEYLAMGLPVVAPNLGQIPSLLQYADGVAGIVYQPDNRQELAAALLRLSRDRAERQRMGMLGASHAQRSFAWETVAQTVVQHSALCDRLPIH